MVQTKGQIIENSNLLFRLHHQRFYPKEVDELLIILRCVITMQFQVLCISRLPNHRFAMQQVDTNA